VRRRDTGAQLSRDLDRLVVRDGPKTSPIPPRPNSATSR
jgi:hypothetical protein